jgi:protocatechuate 3,4-dioxygenase, alpha subunit
MSTLTPSQTVGPYFAIGLAPEPLGINWTATLSNNLVTPQVSGERIRIEGVVLDGDGAPIDDCLIEIWQADSAGRYAHPADQRALPNAGFKGFGRAATDAAGAYAFDTIKPGAVSGADSIPQAPHIVVAVFARGMLRQQYTRIYFADEAANASDPVLGLVPAERRATLMATPTMPAPPSGPRVYRFDIHLQGEHETVFFDV